MYGDERMAKFLGLAFRCPYLCRVGNEDLAHRELEAFRLEVRQECSGEELAKLLSDAPTYNRLIAKNLRNNGETCR